MIRDIHIRYSAKGWSFAETDDEGPKEYIILENDKVYSRSKKEGLYMVYYNKIKNRAKKGCCWASAIYYGAGKHEGKAIQSDIAFTNKYIDLV